jgi:hypothetical protein
MNIDKAIEILQSGLITQQEQIELATLLQAKREWVGLTDDEIRGIFDCGRGRGGLVDIKKAEQILKEKNT